MTKCFLLTVELPDWADKPDRLEMIREEVEQHGGAAAAFYTNATHIVAKCRIVQDLAEPRSKVQSPKSEVGEPTGP